MKRIGSVLSLVVTAGFFLFGAQAALADDCTAAVGGSIVAGECQITGAHLVSGTLQFDETLHMLSGAAWDASAAGVTVNVGDATHPGDMTMEKNSRIFANGDNITVNVPNGDMTMLGTAGTDKCGYVSTAGGLYIPNPATGAEIISRPATLATTITINVGNYPNNVTPSGSFQMERCSLVDVSTGGSAGTVVITAGHDADLDGLVLSESTLSGTGNTQTPGGGPITVKIGCVLTVSGTGAVSSKGHDPGADLVHLEGCDVFIDGLVQSTGPGHVPPVNPPNHCFFDPSKPPTYLPALRPQHLPTDTACIEIIGQNIHISNTGEVNANVNSTGSGGPQGTSWIDMFAYDSFFLTGRTGAGSFLVHANSLSGSDNTTNTITVVAQNGGLTGSGNLFQASDTANGSDGGTVKITTFGPISLVGNTPTIRANGHNGTPNATNGCSAGGAGACGKGGFITVQSWTDQLDWLSGIGNVNPDVAGGTHTGFGVITLLACTGIDTTGTSFGNATVVSGNLIENPATCPALTPPVPAYVQAAFDVGDPIWDACTPSFHASKSGHKFDDPVGDGTFGAPIPGWPINLLTTGNVPITTVFTDVNGFYQFDFIAPGTFRVCEGQKAGVTSTETFPKASTLHPGETVITTCPGANKNGYEFIIVDGSNFTNDDFANHTTTTFCNKQPVIDVLNGRVPDVIVRTDLGQSIQNAVDTVTDGASGPPDGYLIVGVVSNGTGALGGSTTQNVVISKTYTLPFLLIGCSVTMNNPAANAGKPTGWIQSTAASPGNIFVMDLHGAKSDVAGWKVEGNGRTLRNTYGNGNTGNGIWFASNNNVMHNGQAMSNTLVGLRIDGNGNIATDTTVEFNLGNGVQVTGDNNQILKMQIGDIGKGNKGDGLNVNGNNNLLQENTTRGNTLDGVHVVSGTGNKLKKNVSGGTASQDNGDCEYDVAAGNTDLGENKANGAPVTDVVPGVFPTGCIGTP